jgi:tape measure domain-containing protein
VTDQKTLDLIIRAQLKGGKDITSISKSIEELGQAIERQSAAAKRGESSFDELKASLEALKQAQDALTSQGRLIDAFRRSADSIERAKSRVDDTRAALDKYVTKLADVETKTDAQVRKQEKLEASYERSQKTLISQQETYDRIGTSLRELGIDTANLAQVQDRVQRTAADLGVAINKGQQAISTYAEDVRKGREATAALAKQQREAVASADAFAAAEQRASKATAARAQALADFEDRQVSRRGDAAASQRADQEAQQALQRQQQLAELRRDIEERSTTQRRDDGLRKLGQDAEEAARQYTTLARASNNLRPRIVSLREAINGILDPAAQARTTLAGVEGQVSELVTTINGSDASFRDLADQFRKLEAAQRAIGAQSNLIDDFRKQQQAVQAAGAEVVKYRAEVRRYAAAVAQGGDAGEQFTRPLAEAQARLKSASVALGQQATALRASRDALKAAGIDTRNLADAQERLTRAARQSTEAVKRLGDAAKKAGDGGNSAAKGFALFRDEGRTTLSLVQRIRGELLALTAAYVGLQGVLSLAQGSLQASVQAEGLTNTLAFALGGDGAQVVQQIEYLRKEADRLGISFEQASSAYAKFAAAAVKSGAPIQESQFIFESFSEVARVINLTPDQLNGLFNALGQSFSKGKIQAEELRQQIGERLPGAFAFAQEALADVFPNLDKALEQGLVGAENILVIAESIRRAAANQLPNAIKSLDAEQQRFNNSVLFFKKEIADSGFADAYINLLKELTTLLRSEDGEQFAKAISGAFEGVVNAVRFVIRNFNEFQSILFAVAGILAVNLFGTLVTGLLTTAAAAKGAALALTAVQKTVLVLGAAVAGVAIGSYLRKEFLEVELAGIALVRGLLSAWVQIRSGALDLFFDLPRLASNAFVQLLNAFTDKFVRPFLAVTRSLASALGLETAVKGLDQILGNLRLGVQDEVSSRVAQIRKEAEKDLAVIRMTTDDMADEAIARRQPAAARPTPTTTPSPGKRTNNANTELSETAINARQRKIEALDTALNALDAKINRAETQTLQSQLDAVDLDAKRIQKQIDEIRSFNPKAAGEAQARFDRLAEEQRAAVIKKFNGQIEADRLALLARIEQAEVAAGRKDKTSLDARLEAIRTEYAKLYRDIEAQRAVLQGNGISDEGLQADLERAQAAQRAREEAEKTAFARDELARREKEINELLKTREQTLRTTEALVAAGILTRQEADQQSLAVIAQTQPAINALATEGERFAVSMKGALNPVALAEFIAQLNLARASGGALAFELDRTGNIIRNGIGRGIDSTLNTLADSLVDVAQGTKDWGDAFDAVGKSILQSLAGVLREIALAIIRQQILVGLRAATGGSALIPVAHSGMVVGQGSDRTRNVSTAWFANAPRYHTGGVVGLAPDEYPAILQRNEEVLSTSDPRNVMNGGGLQRAGGESKPQRFILVDDRARLAEALAGSEGEEVTMLHLRKNVPTIRQLLKG